MWAAVGAPILMGMAALSVDAARIYNLDHELQAAADALARAGAAELDQRADAMSRADRAINTLVKNYQKFDSKGLGEIQAQSVRFLTALPGTDYETIPESLVTTDPRRAHFLEVSVVPHNVDLVFPKNVVKTVTSVQLTARSTAGSQQGVCGVAPIFICNPYEGDTTTIYEAMESVDFQRKQLLFKTPSKTSTPYGPGNFGFLDPFGGQGGAQAITDAIAVDIPPVCVYETEGVDLRTGNIASLSKGFNVRFDMYEGNFKKVKSNPSYAPAENVVKGYSGKSCKAQPDSGAMGLPKDSCHLNNSCTQLGGRMGDGDWDFLTYMRVNHNEPTSVTIKDITYTFDYANNIVTPGTPPSRYNVYRWEIDSNRIPGRLAYGKNTSTPEEGSPTCHTRGASVADVDRRIMYAAVLNCGYLEENYGMNGSRTGLPLETFVKVFVTEPMGKSQDNQIWGEITGPVILGQDSVAREKVSLAR